MQGRHANFPHPCCYAHNTCRTKTFVYQTGWLQNCPDRTWHRQGRQMSACPLMLSNTGSAVTNDANAALGRFIWRFMYCFTDMIDSNNTTPRNIMCERCQQDLTIWCEMKIIRNSYKGLVFPRRIFVSPHPRKIDVLFVSVWKIRCKIKKCRSQWPRGLTPFFLVSSSLELYYIINI